MPVPVSQMWTVATYVLKQRLKRRQRYPLVLMLEPLFRCNLACAGCGKIQYPAHILKRNLSPEECFKAVDECGAPMVSIPGGEPLMHPEIDKIVEGLVARKKYIYLCTNALLLKEKLSLFKPSKYLTFSVHLDGQREHHDFSVCREGGYEIAVEAVREAIQAGFRVTTNSTLFDGVDPQSVRVFFDEMMDLGVEGIMVAPGYSYDKAPDQQHFLGRARTRRTFKAILSNRKRTWRFNQSPLYLEFLMGKRQYNCTPWGMPTYNLFGERVGIAVLQQIARLLPAEQVVGGHAPWRAVVLALAHEEFQVQRRLIESPRALAIRQDGFEGAARAGASEEVLLVGRFVVGVAGRDHDAFDAQVHHFVEEHADALRVDAVKQRAVRCDAEAGLDGLANGFDGDLVTAFTADREIVVFALTVEMDGEREVLAGLEERKLFFQK